MEKVKRYCMRFTLFVVLLTIGVLLGSKLESSRQEKSRGKLYNSVNIAVVNLDEGIMYQNEQKNYAKELLENYSEKYVLTGLSDAKQGIEDGRYAGYVIIPSDFSNNFVSVNTIPQKSLLKYEINGNLSEEAMDNAWQSVMQLKENINDDVGYVYISSILGEFHNGQDNAWKVLANDSKDKEVLMAISNLDLVTTLDLKEVERLQNNIEDLDINPNIDKNKEIITAIDTTYKEYLGKSATQLSDLQTTSLSVHEDNEKVYDEANNLKNLNNDDGSKNYTVDKTTNILNQYNVGLSTKLASITDILTSSANTEVSKKQDYVKNRTEELDTLMRQVQQTHNTLTSAQWQTFQTNVSTLLEDSIPEEDFDWAVYPTIAALLEDSKTNEPIENAENYIDKIILNQFINIDYTVPDLDYDTCVDNIMNDLSTDETLISALKMYAVSIGKTEEEADVYSLKDYLMDNQDSWSTLPELDTTNKNDQFMTNIETALKTDVDSRLQSHTEDLKTEILELIDQQIPANMTNELQTYVDSYKQSLDTVPIFKTDTLQAHINDVRALDIRHVQSMIDEDLVSLSEEQTEKKKNLLMIVTKHKESNALFHETLLSYDPLKYINANEIQGFVREYESNNTQTNYKIQDKNREYTTFVADSYQNANEQVTSMKEDIHKYQQLSDETITKGLENAKAVRNDTASTNSDLMNSLIQKLPYTRNGTVANNTVYDFVMTSSDMEGSKTDSKVAMQAMDYTIYFISGSLGSGFLLLSIMGYSKYRKKSK